MIRTLNDIEKIIDNNDRLSPRMIARLYYQLDQGKQTWDGYISTVAWIKSVEAKLDEIRIRSEKDNSDLE